VAGLNFFWLGIWFCLVWIMGVGVGFGRPIVGGVLFNVFFDVRLTPIISWSGVSECVAVSGAQVGCWGGEQMIESGDVGIEATTN
jgi:hypothetical protein